MKISSPNEMRTEYIESLISNFHYQWKLEIENGKRDEDIRVRISAIANFELILDQFDPNIYTIFVDGEDTFVRMAH